MSWASSGDDRNHAEKHLQFDVLPENHPRNHGSQHALKVQQQRTRCGRRARQTRHKEGRSGDTSGDDRAGKPRQFRFLNPMAGRGLGSRPSKPARDEPGTESDTASQIEQACDQERGHRAE